MKTTHSVPRIILACILIFHFTGCENKPAGTANHAESPSYFPEHNYNIWQSVTDNTSGLLEIEKVRNAGDSLPLSVSDASTYINGVMNKSWPSVHLKMVKASGDTIYLAIADSTGMILTERIGTTGAMQYIAEVTYNFTEVPNIKYVHLDFEEGEHLSPGTWSRADFKVHKSTQNAK